MQVQDLLLCLLDNAVECPWLLYGQQDHEQTGEGYARDEQVEGALAHGGYTGGPATGT